MKGKRYKEVFEKGSNLILLSEEKDKITKQFYRDSSHLSKKLIHNKNKKLNFIQQIFRLFNGRGDKSKKYRGIDKKFLLDLLNK